MSRLRNVINAVHVDGANTFGADLKGIEPVTPNTAEVRIEHLIEIEKLKAQRDYILSLGWQDTDNKYVKEVIKDADRIAAELANLEEL